LDRQWLARSPFCLIATSDARGRCDVSPKGDPAGFTLVLDDTTVAIPDRPGNKRMDGFRNVLANPHVGLIRLLPGRGDTLRIKGRARLLRDAPFFDDMVVKGNRPRLALLVEIEEVFHHCPKAFLRSEFWKPETWRPDDLPSRARNARRSKPRRSPWRRWRSTTACAVGPRSRRPSHGVPLVLDVLAYGGQWCPAAAPGEI
jgi:uncharacterized protein